MGEPLPGAVLCDVDGVLRIWDGDGGALERRFGLRPGALAAAAFARDRLAAAVTGRISDELWRAGIAADLAAGCGRAAAEAAVAAWSEPRGRVDTAVLDVLAAARARVPVVLVSNGTTRLEHDLDLLGLTGAADAVVNSARVGTAKPGEAIYLAAAQAAGVPVERCFFVDDTLGHVLAARALGMRARVHTGAPGLRAALAGLLAGPPTSP